VSAADDTLDDTLDDDEVHTCPGCGLVVDPGDLWCGVDPACRYVAQQLYPRD